MFFCSLPWHCTIICTSRDLSVQELVHFSPCAESLDQVCIQPPNLVRLVFESTGVDHSHLNKDVMGVAR